MHDYPPGFDWTPRHQPTPARQRQRARLRAIARRAPIVLGRGAAALLLAALAGGVLYLVQPGLLEPWPFYLAALAAPILVTLGGAHASSYERSRYLRPTTAEAWLRARLTALGLDDVAVTSELRGSNFYSHALEFIHLDGELARDHSVAAHAVAAHELGHAWIARRALRHAAMARLARRCAPYSWRLGAGFLFGATMTGASALAAPGAALIALTVLARLGVAVDEAAATQLALRELGATGFAPHELRVARGRLLAALGSYLLSALGLIPLLAIAPAIARQSAGLLHPGGGWASWQAALAALAATAFVACMGYLIAVAARLRRSAALWSTFAAIVGSRLAATTLTLMTWHQPLGLAAPVAAGLAAALLWPSIERLMMLPAAPPRAPPKAPVATPSLLARRAARAPVRPWLAAISHGAMGMLAAPLAARVLAHAMGW